jgi:hypothetical protein
VRDVTVLERICDGLGVPREFMRLAGCAEGDGAYPGRVTVAGRRKLEPLAAALEARPGRDAQDLARMARQAAIAGA